MFLDEATRRRALEVGTSVILGAEDAYSYVEGDDTTGLDDALATARTEYVPPPGRPLTEKLPDE